MKEMRQSFNFKMSWMPMIGSTGKLKLCQIQNNREFNNLKTSSNDQVVYLLQLKMVPKLEESNSLLTLPQFKEERLTTLHNKIFRIMKFKFNNFNKLPHIKIKKSRGYKKNQIYLLIQLNFQNTLSRSNAQSITSSRRLVNQMTA